MNPPLTQFGVSQARELGERLKAVEFDCVYSSDMARAADTAACLRGKRHEITPDFREINMGELYHKSWDDFPEIKQKFAARAEDIAYPGGERGEDVWLRCKSGLEKIERADGKLFAIVSHGGAIRSMICGILGLKQYKRFELGAPVENCSISIILSDDGYKLHSFNIAPSQARALSFPS